MRLRATVCKWFFGVAVLLTAVGCAGDELTPAGVIADADVPVSFSPYLQQAREGGTTRADNEGLAQLKSTGFMVFASHHGADDYSLSGTGAAGTRAFNFMYNENLHWNSTAERWEYSPVKYWPNGTDEPNADGSPSNTATESGQQKVSFFAIAPYFEYKSDHAGYPACITEMTANSEPTASSYVEYTAPLTPDAHTDLMWADALNLYKHKSSGEGYVNGHVQLPFVHALTQIGVTVQARVDESDGYSSDIYPHTVNEWTRVFIERVSIGGLVNEAQLMLTNETTTPRWTTTSTGEVTIDGNGSGTSNATLTESLSNTYMDGSMAANWAGDGTVYYLNRTYADAAEAETAFGELPEGVTAVEQGLYKGGNFWLPPSTLGTVSITYYVVTYDPSLELNTPKYFSIVKNEVSYTPSAALDYNKVYRLRLLLGLTSVKFELLELDEWGEAVILSAIVKDWDVETQEYNVE